MELDENVDVDMMDEDTTEDAIMDDSTESDDERLESDDSGSESDSDMLLIPIEASCERLVWRPCSVS